MTLAGLFNHAPCAGVPTVCCVFLFALFRHLAGEAVYKSIPSKKMASLSSYQVLPMGRVSVMFVQLNKQLLFWLMLNSSSKTLPHIETPHTVQYILYHTALTFCSIITQPHTYDCTLSVVSG